MLGYVPWLLTMWFARPRQTEHWPGLAVGIPLLALVGVAPWLVRIAPLLGGDIRSPFEISSAHMLIATVYHGPLVVLLSLPGIALALRRRAPFDLLMLVWLILVYDFSSFGVLKALFGGLLEPILRYDYPFSIAWHGPIIPYLYFAAVGLLWLLDRRRAATDRLVRAASVPVLVATALVALILVANADAIVAASKNTPFMMYGAFSSRADVRAMEWLKANTTTDVLILNHPGLHEADWGPVIAQRDMVYFRPQPFFRGAETALARQEALRAFWRDPTDAANEALLAQHGIDYVLVPQVFTQPEALRGMFRWRPPLPEAASYAVGAVADAPYLTLVYEDEGAQVYRVR
jgi:hypothetical protein